MVAQHWRAQFEWYAHAQLAQKAGISQGIIDSIHRSEKPKSMDAQEEAIWQFAKELLQTQRVSEPTFARTKELFGQHGVVDLVGVMGYYGLVSMTLNTFQVPLPEGEPLPFKE
jgi:4-carboxymuconolactone decarboxylase